MKTKVASLLVVLVLIATQCMAQQKITVEAQNNDISNNLDLKAVATVFGESKNLEEFEQKLNDYESGISNLDLNNDGQVDYLRVIEKNENNIHVVVIQAVLDKNVYQDVASIVVERDQENNNTTVQVIGDPYIYGNNYVIEPAYVYTPSIFSFFWGPAYFSWYSPYYWGYYPHYYHHRNPYEVNIYMSNVYGRIDHNQRYYYTNARRDARAESIYSSVRRNDYAVRYPDRTFSSRNQSIRNKRDLEFSRSGVIRNSTRSSYQDNSAGSRNVRSSNGNGSRNSQSNVLNQGSSNQRTYTPSNQERSNTYQSRTSNSTWQNSGSGRSQSSSSDPIYSPRTNSGSSNTTTIQRNNNYQPRQNTDNGVRNSAPRSTNSSTPSVSQPARTSAPQRQVESPRSSESRSSTRSESRSGSGDSRR
jgi:phosphoribosyl-AMP cyclohydrolase